MRKSQLQKTPQTPASLQKQSKQPPPPPPDAVVADPASAIYLNADDNVEGFVENLFNEYKIRASIERVLDYLDTKLKKKSNKLRAYVAFSKKLLKEKSYKHANNLLSEGLQKYPDNAHLMCEMGKLKYVTQIYPEAADAFSAALKLKDIDKMETLYNLALTHLQMGKNVEALENLKEVLKISPDYVEAVATLGVAYKRLGKKDEALKVLNQALTLAPNDQEVMNNIGSIFYEQEKYDKAAEQFLKALQLKPEDVEILSNLGNALTKAKNYQDAWVAFDEALKIRPADTQIIENYLLCLLEGKQFDRFDEMLGKIQFLTADVKSRLQSIADEYKATLGVKGKKPGAPRKPAVMGSPSRRSIGSILQRSKSGANFSDDARPSLGAKPKVGGLHAVEEEAD